MKLSQQPEFHFIEINSLFQQLATLSPQNTQMQATIVTNIREELERLHGLGFNVSEYEKKLASYI